jgi:hypothetical protein
MADYRERYAGVNGTLHCSISLAGVHQEDSMGMEEHQLAPLP